MPQRAVIRILSDLHFDDSSSALHSLAQLRPLLEGADHVVLNGDTLDSQVIGHGAEMIAKIKKFFAEHVPATTFITGNHDPDISDVHELTLAGGLVWCTHGDVLWEDVAPWSQSRPELRRRIAKAAASLPPSAMGKIENRLRVFRQICVGLPHEHDPNNRSVAHRVQRLARAVFPPKQAWEILKAWRDMPRLAIDLAEAQRPHARFILVGHTHGPGVWSEHGPRVVINTGSCCPPRGALMVEIADGKLSVLRVLRHHGAFRRGPALAEFPLAETKTSA